MKQLIRANDLAGYRIQAMDGPIGRVSDYLFDRETWIVRYLIINKRPGLLGGRILLSRDALQVPDYTHRMLPVSLRNDQIRKAPTVNPRAPVPRALEEALHRHYSWVPYWGSAQSRLGTPSTNAIAATSTDVPTVVREKQAQSRVADVHVHRLRRMNGYAVNCRNGRLGYVRDQVLELPDWRIRYLITSTRRRLPGQQRLIIPSWIERVSWQSRSLQCKVEKDIIQESPPFHPAESVQADYRHAVDSYYQKHLGSA